MSEAPAAEVFDLLGDRYVRDILTATSEEPMSAKELSEHCDMSVSTVYRRVEELQDHGLVAERTQLDPEGHHRTLYEASLSGLDVDLTGDGFRVTVERRADAADRFTRVWEGIRGE